MAIPKEIRNYLLVRGATYSQKTHPVAYTAQQVAAVEHILPAELAKTVVLKADERLILAVLPADHAIDMEVLKKLAGCTKLALASESEFRDRFDFCLTGAMPPFGRFFDLEVFCDAALSQQPEIEFNGGTHTDTIRMRFTEFARLEIPVVAFFSRESTGSRWHAQRETKTKTPRARHWGLCVFKGDHMKRLVMLLMLISVAMFAAAATPVMGENCPMKLPGTDVAVSDTPTGVTITVTTKAENVADLQRRVERMALMHSGDRPTEAMLHGQMVPGTVKYEAIDNGARLTLAPKDPEKLAQFRTLVREHVERMKKGECSMMGDMMQGMMGGMGKPATQPETQPEKDETDHSAHHPAGKP